MGSRIEGLGFRASGLGFKESGSWMQIFMYGSGLSALKKATSRHLHRQKQAAEPLGTWLSLRPVNPCPELQALSPRMASGLLMNIATRVPSSSEILVLSLGAFHIMGKQRRNRSTGASGSRLKPQTPELNPIPLNL